MTKQEEINRRLNEEWRNYETNFDKGILYTVNDKGMTLLAFIQSEIDLAVAEERKRIVEEIEKSVSYAECESPGEGKYSRAYYYHLDKDTFKKLSLISKPQ